MNNPAEILAQLDPQQQQAAQYLSGPVCIRAGAGSGKTRTITHRIAYGIARGDYPPNSVLAVTFTAKAATEMRYRLHQLGADKVTVNTFHAEALKQIRYYWPTAVGGNLPKIIEYKASLIATALHQLKLANDKNTVRDISAELEWAAVNMIEAENYPKQASQRTLPPGIEKDKMVQIIQTYRQIKQQRNGIDFEDILLICAGMILERPDIAAQIRQKYQYIIVDEYQDLSPLQFFLLDQWLGENQNICVVGDASQTIYSFAGASPKYLLQFAQKWPKTRSFKLENNYRSTPEIVALANQIISADQSTAENAITLKSQKPSGKSISIKEYQTDQEETQQVAEHIKTILLAGEKAKNIAILYRTNMQAIPLEQALTALGIPFNVKGDKPFFQHTEILKTINSLRRKQKIQPNTDIIEAVTDAIIEQGWRQNPSEKLSKSLLEKQQNLNELLNIAKEQEEKLLNLLEFLEYLDKLMKFEHSPATDKITLCSAHTAKGLEWKIVYLIGASEGLIPFVRAKTEEEKREERRLAYVIVTRAQEELHISYAIRREQGGKKRKISQFFQQCKHQDKVAQPIKNVYIRKKARKKILENSTIQEQKLFETLVQWRLKLAQKNNKPAYTILSDLSLAEIAQQRPQNTEQLLRIRGVGAVKSHKYGSAILAIVKNSR